MLTSKVDRSDMGRRCGNKGHLANGCEREPQCMLCMDTQQDAKHIAGNEQTIRQRGTGVALISEPYRGRMENGCYAPPSWEMSVIQDMVERLTEDARGRAPLIIAGDFNAWAVE
ncbi:hypothetical protein ACLKA6_003655 [Drosophila palustris]